MRNEIWLHYYCPKNWRTEEPITFTEGLSQYVIIPDATFTIEGKYYFLEVDRTQSMADNKKKIELYSKLQPLIQQQFKIPPTLVFYTLTPLRSKKLKSLCKEYEVNCLVYTKEDLF
jgi:hypothetical protein